MNDSYLLLWIAYWTQSELALAASQTSPEENLLSTASAERPPAPIAALN